MTKAYDFRGADRLIPLLRSVQREIRERGDAIRRIRVRLAGIPDDQRESSEFLSLQAQLSNQKLQIRLARKELERLGCSVDEHDSRRVLIPGRSGELTDGFAWSFGDTQVHALVAENLG